MKAVSTTTSMFCDHRAHSFTCVRAHFCGENKVYSFGGTAARPRWRESPHSTSPLGAADCTTSVASNSIGATTGKLEGPVGECYVDEEKGRRGKGRGQEGEEARGEVRLKG